MSSNRCSICAAARYRRRLVFGLLSLPLLAIRRSGAQAVADKAVANLVDLAEPWSSVKLALTDSDGDEVPCIVVRLQDGGWYASSLVCPHNKCDIIYVTDPRVTRNTFDVDVDAPVLACPCHFSVFDLSRHGKVIAGPAPSPPLQLKVEVRDDKVFISR